MAQGAGRTARWLLVMFLLAPLSVLAQSEKDEDSAPIDSSQVASVPLYVQTGKMLHGKDSIFHVIMPTVHKYPPVTFKTEKEQERYNRLVMNVKKVLPIAKLVKQTMLETYEYLETLPNDKARDEHIVAVEKGLKKQYTPLLKKLSFSQGKLLIKLVDRECGQSSYEMVQAFLGPFRAGLYQVFAWGYGSSLKKRYDPMGEDRFTERVVRMVESGQL